MTGVEEIHPYLANPAVVVAIRQIRIADGSPWSTGSTVFSNGPNLFGCAQAKRRTLSTVPRTPPTLDQWRAALPETWKREGKTKQRGKSPVCGGPATVGPGKRAPVIWYCFGNGCKFADVAKHLFPAEPIPFRRNRSRPANPLRSPSTAKPKRTRPKPPSHGTAPDFPALADHVERTLALGPAARTWLEGRGLDPEPLGVRGWVSAEDPTEWRKIDPEPFGVKWPGRFRSALLCVIPDLDGRANSLRVRSLTAGPSKWLSLPDGQDANDLLRTDLDLLRTMVRTLETDTA